MATTTTTTTTISPSPSSSQPPSVFSESQFLTDFTTLADALSSPYSLPKIRSTLTTFSSCFAQSAVIWRTTNRPNDVINYRFYLCGQSLDTIQIAASAGYLSPDNRMAKLAASWSACFAGDTEQWCDFHPVEGLAKTWVNLKGRRPLDEVLAADAVPDAVRAHRETFRRLGLELVRFVAVDYDAESLNLYFTAPGPLTEEQAAQYTGLVAGGCSPPTEAEFRDMKEYLNPKGYAFAVTMGYDGGEVKRVAFYALDIPEEKELPATVNDRVRKFFKEAVSYDRRRTRNVAWSFGKGGSKYIKAESSYVGELATVLQDVGSPLAKRV